MSVQDFKERQRAKRLATCKHFTGIMNEACAVGVAYRPLRDTSKPGLAKWPCMGTDCVNVCDKKELNTAEEVDAEEREFQERLSHFVPAREAIIATGKAGGTIDCPRCNLVDGLYFTVSSYNGHVHAACRTMGCLSWME
jgi:hypothetical protein